MTAKPTPLGRIPPPHTCLFTAAQSSRTPALCRTPVCDVGVTRGRRRRRRSRWTYHPRGVLMLGICSDYPESGRPGQTLADTVGRESEWVGGLEEVTRQLQGVGWLKGSGPEPPEENTHPMAGPQGFKNRMSFKQWRRRYKPVAGSVDDRSNRLLEWADGCREARTTRVCEPTQEHRSCDRNSLRRRRDLSNGLMRPWRSPKSVRGSAQMLHGPHGHVITFIENVSQNTWASDRQPVASLVVGRQPRQGTAMVRSWNNEAWGSEARDDIPRLHALRSSGHVASVSLATQKAAFDRVPGNPARRSSVVE